MKPSGNSAVLTPLLVAGIAWLQIGETAADTLLFPVIASNSPNVVRALEEARDKGLPTLGMTGRGGALTRCSDLLLTVDSDVTARIQETHITMGHILCELVDTIMFQGRG